MNPIQLSVSIVSHGHRLYVERLLADLARLGRTDLEVILTLNLPENLQMDCSQSPYGITLIQNDTPKGFAANHNAAFAVARGENFVILNPDISLPDDPFDALLLLRANTPASICAPLIVNRSGGIEDSARNFPTPSYLLRKLFCRIFKRPMPAHVLPSEGGVLMPDWVAGMFILCPRATYAQLHGLSEHYHLYYEDVDFCARARLAGHQVLVSTKVKAVHEAQRDSHRKLRFLSWHVRSALRFFASSVYAELRAYKMLRD